MKNKKRITWLLVLLLFLCGCETQESVLLTPGNTESLNSQNDLEETQDLAEEVSEQTDSREKTGDTNKEKADWIYVDVSGAVCAPGVYRIEAGSRVFQVLEQAGGCTQEASLENINQADLVSDGEKIRIYTQEELEQQGNLTEDTVQSQEKDSRVNINRAGKEELMTLTGIGETRALAILAYREAHGTFSNVEELMQVEGIKEKTYEKLKDQIRIN